MIAEVRIVNVKEIEIPRSYDAPSTGHDAHHASAGDAESAANGNNTLYLHSEAETEHALRITFNDTSISDFAVRHLLREVQNEGAAPMQGPRLDFPDRYEWNASLVQPPLYTYENLHSDYLDHFITTILTTGAAIVDGVPMRAGFCTEFGRGISTLRETEWGKEFNVRTVPDDEGKDAVKKDLAYTPLPIGLHTDNPYRDPMPDFQILHQIDGCTCENDIYPCEKCHIDNLFADGFAVARKLYEEDPEAFALLSKISVRWENNGGDGTGVLISHKPVIELEANSYHLNEYYLQELGYSRSGSASGNGAGVASDGGLPGSCNNPDCIVAIRHSAKSGGYTPLLPPEVSDAYFRARRKFSAMLAEEENVIKLHLKPGRMVVFDNKRILHARSPVVSDKPRFLQGCYVNRDGLWYTFAKLQTKRGGPGPRFTSLVTASKEDFEGMGKQYQEQVDNKMVDTFLDMLKAQKGKRLGQQVDLYQHQLQTASRAYRAGESVDIVVMSLFHDVTESIVSKNHGAAAAAFLEPYLDPKATWMLKHHEVFQGYYYFHYFGADQNAREKYKTEPYYEDLVRWCQEYDQASFDPIYPPLPPFFFKEMVREVLARPAFWFDTQHPLRAAVTGVPEEL